jgi:rhodanese-related sulfurtransferase
MTKYQIDRHRFKAWLEDGDELAVLDIRPPEEVGYASPLFATNLPAARVKAELDRYVPRRTVRTVLVDDGSGIADRLVAELRQTGWLNLHALQGGIPAWITDGIDGLPTFDIPGVAFSTAVRDEKRTPVISATELHRWQQDGTDVVVLDSRTVAEYEQSHVPGAIAVPGAELLLRFADLVPDPATRVVVSCAGLPRAILGAQTLIDAGVPNPVAFLDDGTRGWTNAGFGLETGPSRVYGPASEPGRRSAEKLATQLSADDALTFVDRETAHSWSHDPDRTTYLLDVRTPEEHLAGHLPGSISSEGGQLLGVSYRTLAVRGSRIVLVDDLLGARAPVVAHWLQRRGFEIAILLEDFEAGDRAAA